MTTPVPVTELSYEQARDELAAIVTKLESGSGTLEESLALWERGEQLAARCGSWLDQAQARLDQAQARLDQAQAPLDAANNPQGAEGESE